MLGEIIGLGLVGLAALGGRQTFYDYYTADRVNLIRQRASNRAHAEQDILLFLHNYSRNVGRPRTGDVTGILGNYAYGILLKMQDRDLIRFDKDGYIRPGKQLASRGSFVTMYTGGQ